jgi:hypothetical protein
VRKQQAYYWVFAVKDGIIWYASPKRKPIPSTVCRRPKIDQDGVFRWSIGKMDEDAHYTPVAKVIRGATIATCLNVRRLLRETVAARLDRLEAQLAGLQEQLARVEQILDRGTIRRESNG